MAFEKIYEFVDEIEKRMKKIREQQDAMLNVDNAKWEAQRTERWMLHAKWCAHFEALITYLETTLKTAKFKDQRRHCIEVMTRLNPAFMEGYLRTRAQLKRETKPAARDKGDDML